MADSGASSVRSGVEEVSQRASGDGHADARECLRQPVQRECVGALRRDDVRDEARAVLALVDDACARPVRGDDAFAAPAGERLLHVHLALEAGRHVLVHVVVLPSPTAAARCCRTSGSVRFSSGTRCWISSLGERGLRFARAARRVACVSRWVVGLLRAGAARRSAASSRCASRRCGAGALRADPRAAAVAPGLSELSLRAARLRPATRHSWSLGSRCQRARFDHTFPRSLRNCGCRGDPLLGPADAAEVDAVEQHRELGGV